MTRTLLIASDHGGFDLKQHLLGFLAHRGFKILDLGTDSQNSVDYPDFGRKAAQEILAGKAELGIVICGTGIGISISANRFKGIRCALCGDAETAKLARQHNNANMLALAGRFLGKQEAEKTVLAFLEADFEGGRHNNRIVKIDSAIQ